MKTRHFLTFLCLSFFTQTNSVAQNLIKNASFEASIPLPYKHFKKPSPFFRTAKHVDFILFSKGFSTVLNSTPDVITSDNNMMEFADFKNFHFTNFKAKTGKQAIGIRVLGCKVSEICCREFIQIPLSDTMKYKRKYHVEYWASRMAGSPAIPLSILFAKDSLSFNPMDKKVQLKAQWSTDSVVGTNAFEWVRIADTIMAAENYRYMIIGNFINEDHKTQQKIIETDNLNPFSYYFIDDVSVIPLESMQRMMPTLSLSDVNFQTGTWQLRPIVFPVLDSLARALKAYDNYKIELLGHTDNTGATTSNQILSEKRAQAIKSYLVKKGISAEKIIAQGKGETEPIRENDTEQGRKMNRRVEIFVKKE